MDEETLEAYVRALRKSAEYLNKEINPIELKALIRRFMKLNPNADPRTVDWVAVWDDKLTYSELLDAFQRNYPGYRWREAEEITEEAFEHMRRRKVEEVAEVIRELDEESLKELFELIKKELEPEAEVEPEALPEKPQEAVVQEVTPMPTLAQEAPAITLGVLSRYPILPETRQFFETFAVEELEGYAEATKLRITEALQRGEKGVLPREDAFEDLLTFGLARVLCIAIGEPWLLKRWALAEASRMERFLHVETKELKEMVLKTVLNIEAVDDRRLNDEFEYRIHFSKYLQLIRELSGPEWRLVNRMLTGGYVYLTEAEAVRLFRQRAYQMLSSVENVPKIKVQQLPPKLQEAAEDVMRELVKLRSSYAYEEITSAPSDDWPPCMMAIRTRIAEASHRELFTITAYMINKGYSMEQILALISERPDFNERIARYQVEHIAGLRGSRTKYKPPSCQTMKAYGLCIEDGRLCPKGIRNPLDFKPKDRQKGVQKHEQTTQTPP
jgi:DNA primase large subunit